MYQLKEKEQPVGYMVAKEKYENGCGFVIYCAECVPSYTNVTPIYHVNIYPYHQHCFKCGKVLVEGESPSWPELYE